MKNLHRSGKLRKDHNMKKNIIAVLLVIALSTAAAFAVDPTTSDSFQVTTAIGPSNLVKFATATATNVAEYNAASDLSSYSINGTETVGTAGTAIGYVLTQTNNRNGYTLKLRADKLNGGEGYALLNYSVEIGSALYNTSTAEEAVTIDTVTGITGRTVFGYPIKIQLNAVDAAAATAGNYNGTVYVEYYAN